MAILYFGDFDPSGEDMIRSLRERLAFFECLPEIVKVALTPKQIETYSLPPDFTKATDRRREAFVEEHGDVSVELDAMPTDALRGLLAQEVEARMDLEALAATRRVEMAERRKLADMLGGSVNE